MPTTHGKNPQAETLVPIAGDQGRNGYFDRAFNSGYDATEDAYFMVHGGTTVPDTAFGTGRTLQLPTQTNQEQLL